MGETIDYPSLLDLQRAVVAMNALRPFSLLLPLPNREPSQKALSPPDLSKPFM